TYSKVINRDSGIEDRPRFDFINNKPIPGDVEDQLIVNFSSVYSQYDIIFVSDQAETIEGGVVTDAFREVMSEVAEAETDKLVSADSRRRIHKFRGVLAKPNADEADAASRELCSRIDYQKRRRSIGPRPMLVTHAEQGVLLVRDGSEKLIPA